jgi:carnitine O-acetyltransferase
VNVADSFANMAIRTFTRPNSLDKKLKFALNNMGNPDEKARSNSNHRRSSPKSASPKPGSTFAFQDQLPQLPIPDLESTVQKYLDSLRPLQTPKEHSDSRIAAREFLKYQGPDLQEKLKKYASGRSNYIEQFCKQSLYLGSITRY